MRAVQCQKSLYLHNFHKDLRDEQSPRIQALFSSGKAVGHLARDLFPGGVDCSPPDSFQFQHSVSRTQAAVEAGQPVIYEAAFQSEGVLAAIDILVKNKDGSWNAYEVKSSTSAKKQYIQDAALQYWVIDRSGIALNDIAIIHLNTNYIRSGDLDLERLFVVVSILGRVRDLQPWIESEIAHARATLSSKETPDIDIGEQCRSPYTCDFYDYCWGKYPETSVFELSGLNNQEKWDLWRQGIHAIPDVPAEKRQRKKSVDHFSVETTGIPIIDVTNLRLFLNKLQYPLYYLDFEAANPAIPPFDGTRPFRHIPFQFSIHIEDFPEADLKHIEFIGDGRSDPRKLLAESLVTNLENSGTILMYSKFERTMINSLIKEFPDHAQALKNIRKRLLDMAIPFQKRHYMTKEMRGRYSIKFILPALAPELSYNGLEIADGNSAQLAYQALANEKDALRIDEIKNQLLAYCRLDTLAMVRIMGKLRDVSK